MSEIRVCENCKHHNNINNLECEKCGFDLSFVIPVEESEIKQNEMVGAATDVDPAEGVDSKCSLSLVSLDGELTIPIQNELVIGRDGVNGDFFEKSNYVSRKHAIFYIENDEVFVFDASTNGTFLNDKRLPKLTKTPVHHSDKITFADVSFEVRYADR